MPGREDSPRAAAGPGHRAGESWREVGRTRGGIIILISLLGKFCRFLFLLFSIISKEKFESFKHEFVKLYQTSNKSFIFLQNNA